MALRWWLLGGAMAAIVVGELALTFDNADILTVVADALAAAALFGVAVVAVDRPNGRRLAVIAAAAACVWLAANLVSGIAPFHRPLIVHVALGSHDGRLRGNATRAVVIGAWMTTLLVPYDPGWNVALGTAVAAVAAFTFFGGSIVRRPWSTAAALAGVLSAVAIAGPSLLRLIDPTRVDAELVAAGYAMLVALAAGLRILGVLLHDDAGPELADAVVELTAVGSHDVDDVVASVGRGGADASDPAIARALVGVTELLEDNRALHVALEAQVEEVRRSRLRLLEAADLERRRLAARLDATAGRHLAELGTTISVLKGTTGGDSADILDRVEEELAGTRDDLEQLARGLHPRLLVEEGLRASLLDLARRSAVPTDVSAPDQRFPAVVETTVWYVCAEAAVNVAKHADARTMSIAVAIEADGVVATIADDGVGGARAGAGTGLAGLADRVDAVGGRLEVRSEPGRGTWLRAWVPVA